MGQTPSQSASQLSLRLRESRLIGAEALSKIHKLLSSRSPEAQALVWQRCPQSTREIWLAFARMDRRKGELPWDRLPEGDRERLIFTLSVMTEFFVSIGHARRRALAG